MLLYAVQHKSIHKSIQNSPRVFVILGERLWFGGDGELGCLCGKAGTSHLCDGSAHSSGCVVNGSYGMAAF